MSSGDAGVEHKPWMLVAATAVVVVVIGVVVVFGLIPYPDLPTVADQPVPPVTAQLAYTSYERAGQCLHVVDGRGQDRELGCGGSYEGDVVWLEDGRLGVRSYMTADPVIQVLDIDTGDVVDRVADPRDQPESLARTNEAGQRVTTGGRGGRTWVEVTGLDDQPRRVLELEGPASYQLYDAGWSTDGRWVVAQDSVGRVVVVDAAGRAEARIWATDVGAIAVR